MAKRILITGGTQRLGAELVRAFSSAGHEVWCHFQHSKNQARALKASLAEQGITLHLISADLGQASEMQTMMDSIEREGGALDVVVNNASMFVPDEGRDFLVETARLQLDVNLIAPMFLGQLLARQQAKGSGGEACVIHVLDQKIFNLNPDYFSYTLSKLALERAVELQAQALAPAVRVCGVSPGLMYLSGPQLAENFEIASRINLRRQATDPCDVAKTCVFLAETSSITGTTVRVDNGQHLVPLTRDVMFVVEDWLKTKI